MRLKDKVAIITGAGRGIGRAIAVGFAKEGAKLVLVSRTESELSETADLIVNNGDNAIWYAIDLRDEERINWVVEITQEKFGRVDILVNNAGALLLKSTVDMTTEEWDYILDVNLRGVFIFSREVLKIMIGQNYGKIINFSSQLGRQGMAARSAYSAAKFGVIGLTESMASEVKKYNININAICPGGVDTKMVRECFPPGDYTKLMQPEDISKVALFLASDESRAIKGKVIESYGGQDLVGFADDVEFRWIVTCDGTT